MALDPRPHGGPLPILNSLAPGLAPQSLPTVAALDAIWQRVQSKPLYAPPSFWRFLRLSWRSRTRLLDPDTVRRIAPIGKVNDCSGCTEICCVGSASTVLLRLRDIATLLDLGRTDLITKAKPTFRDDQMASKPALRRQVTSSAWATFPVLRQNSFGACLALTTEGKCSIYPHWPMSCARFPYALHADEQEVFYSRRCDSFWIRPDLEPAANAMAAAAVAAYNERIKDIIILAYAFEALCDIGLDAFLEV